MTGLSLPGVAAGIPESFNPLQTVEAVAAEENLSQEVGRMERLAVDYATAEPVGRVHAAAVTPEPGATPPAALLQSPSLLEPPPISTIYEVQPGDTVSSIAAAHGLQSSSVIWNNVEVANEDVLAVGQLLRLPAMDGVIHEVRLDETLSDVADRYGVDLSAITTFTSNGIQTPDDIQEQQLVFVPGGTVAPPPAASPEAEV